MTQEINKLEIHLAGMKVAKIEIPERITQSEVDRLKKILDSLVTEEGNIE